MTTILFPNYVLKDVFFKLCFKNTFKNIFEYSLLSKSIFQIFQNIITNDTKDIELLLNWIPFKQYIENYNIQNAIIDKIKEESLYKRKLIQFKQVQYLKLQFEENKSNFVYNYLKKWCPLVKNVQIVLPTIKYIYFSTSTNVPTEPDYSKGGYFSYDSITCDWLYAAPTTSKKEIDELRIVHEQERIFYPFSFDFLNLYHPIKLNISSQNITMETDYFRINSILSYKSIDTIKFKNKITPNSLIKQMFSSISNIKSCTLVIDNIKNQLNNDQHDYIFQNNDNQDFIFNQIYNYNTNLRKLVIRKTNKTKFSKDNDINLLGLFKFLNCNECTSWRLKSLSLEVFLITNLIQLEPLSKYINLTTLYCNTISIPIILEYCNINSNIKTLKYYFNGVTLKPSEIQLFNEFFKVNKSLSKLLIYYTLPHLENQFKKIIQSFENSNNTILQLKIKDI